jgi:hypothetical protein
MRITGTDWIDGGVTPDEAGIFAGELRNIGFDYVCVSSGGISPAARPAITLGYQIPLAAAVKKASGIAVQAVGMIVDPHQAEKIVAEGHADCVALARGFLDDPRWAWHAAAVLGADAVFPPQYLRARPEQLAGRGAYALSTDAGAHVSSEPTRYDDGPQPVADLGRPANGIHNFARNPVPPNQVAAGRLCVQGAIISCDRDDLGRLGAKALFDKLGGSHLNEGRRDRQGVLGVILRAVETAAPRGLRGYRLNSGDLVRRQDIRVRRQRFDLVEVRAKRVENGGTGREKRVASASFRCRNRPSDRQLASARVAPDRSSERHHGKL